MIYIPLVILATIVGLLVRHGVRIERKLEARTAELRSETGLRKANEDAAASRLAMLDGADKARAQKAEALGIAERKNREYFYLIERILAQRDEWTEMFYTHSIEHQRAQAKLEGEIIRTREQLMHAVKIVNAYRAKNNEPNLQLPFATVSDEPVGTAKAFGEKMEAMKAKASSPVDGIKERDAIKGG